MMRSYEKVLPSAFNYIGLLSAGLTAATVPHWWSSIFLVLSLFLGGFNGRWVILANSPTPLGMTMSSVINRITEVFWAIAFYRLGAPLMWVFGFASLVAFEEYAKARLALVDEHKVNLVTLSDRTVRASSLLLAIILLHVTSSRNGVGVVVVAVTILQGISFILFIRFAYKQIH
jgi:hypothetical protein